MLHPFHAESTRRGRIRGLFASRDVQEGEHKLVLRILIRGSFPDAHAMAYALCVCSDKKGSM